MNTTPDPRWQFQAAMLAAGVGAPDQIQADGLLHRFRAEGDRPGKRSGWYILHTDGRMAGAYGSWRLGIRETWCSGGDGRTLTKAERDRLAAEIARARAKDEAERDRAHGVTAAMARRRWSKARPADPSHAYLLAKAVPPLDLRQEGRLLLAPLLDMGGTLWSLQTIAPDGQKLFLKGGRVAGLSTPIGDLEAPGRVLICEGFSTGATLHQQSGSAVLCAMNCRNLKPVALAARQRWPEADIVICADDDRHTAGNPGLTAAREAAAAIGGRLAVPQFPPGVDGSDFNDLARALAGRAAA